MIDSTNPRILANNIKKLLARINAIVPGTVVAGNPSGSGFNTLLTKIKIGDNKYKLPDAVVGNPEDEATDDLTKLKIGSQVFNVKAGSAYSEVEQIIGKWIDDTTLYEKVIDLGENTNISNDSWQSISQTISNLDLILNCRGFNTNGTFYDLMATHTSGAISVLSGRNGSGGVANVRYIILEYTKSS